MPSAVNPSPLLTIGAGLAKVPSAIRAGEQEYEAYEMQKIRRKQAQQNYEKGELQLREMGRQDELKAATHDTRVAELQQRLQEQEQAIRLQGQKMFREDTYRSIDSVLKEQNFNQFNNFLQEATTNPYAPQIMRDTLRIDPISLESEADKQALYKAGITPEQLDNLDGTTDNEIDWNLVKRRFVLATTATGEKEVRDVFRLGVVTGYGDWADAQGRTRLKELADISKSQKGNSNKPSAFQEKVQAEDAYQTRLKKGEEPTAAEVAGHRLFLSETAGDSPVRQEHVNEARTSWKTKGFDKLSQRDLQRNNEARNLVNIIEENHGMSAEERKEVRALTSMVALSKEAGGLSDKQTGLLDKMLSGASNYVSEEVGDKTARAAYGAFINQFRHELFGSALTEGELAAFKEAYGALGQKTGPVLAGLRAALIQVKSKLDTIASFNDPIVVKFRMGMTMDEVQSAMDGVDERIKFYDLVASGVSPDTAWKQIKGDAKSDAKEVQTPTAVQETSSQQTTTGMSEADIEAALMKGL